eukprot:4078353-Amphidinium_carterae.1
MDHPPPQHAIIIIINIINIIIFLINIIIQHLSSLSSTSSSHHRLPQDIADLKRLQEETLLKLGRLVK